MSENPGLLLAIVDDHPVVVEGLRSLLLPEPDVTVISFGSAGALLASDRLADVHLILLDLNLPDRHGLEVCRILKESHPGIRVLVISNQAERSIILQALQSGAAGYILKNTDGPGLLGCIHAALEGRLAVCGAVQAILAKPGGPDELKEMPRITRREKEILQCLAGGATTAEIAAQLFLSPLTVETHRRNLLQKFGVRNVAGLIRKAGSYRLLD